MRIPDDRPSPAIEDLRRYGGSLADAVAPSQANAVVMRALAARGRPRRSRRLVLALAIVGLLAVSNVGLALVSDNAAPGDLLYPFDRGYEWAADLFGTRGRATERLSESQALDRRGHSEDAIEFLRDELAADSRDRALLIEAIVEIRRRTDRAQGTPPDPLPSTTSPTAPGLTDDERGGPPLESPSDTAPGQIRDDGLQGSPNQDAPGQNKEVEKRVRPSDSVPGTKKTSPPDRDVGGRGSIKDKIEP